MDKVKKYARTYGGNKIDYEHPETINIDFKEIAYSLAKLCRFSGHIRNFYSVAEHQCTLYDAVKGTNDTLAKWLLVHDAPEAYINDLPTPLKNLLPEYKAIETVIEDSILEKVGISRDNFSYDVFKHIDREVLNAEKSIRHTPKWRVSMVGPYKFHFWGPRRAYKEYKKRLLIAFPHLQEDFN